MVVRGGGEKLNKDSITRAPNLDDLKKILKKRGMSLERYQNELQNDDREVKGLMTWIQSAYRTPIEARRVEVRGVQPTDRPAREIMESAEFFHIPPDDFETSTPPSIFEPDPDIETYESLMRAFAIMVKGLRVTISNPHNYPGTDWTPDENADFDLIVNNRSRLRWRNVFVTLCFEGFADFACPFYCDPHKHTFFIGDVPIGMVLSRAFVLHSDSDPNGGYVTITGEITGEPVLIAANPRAARRSVQIKAVVT